ncbi:MAG: MASE1 domain-containing protein [Pseudomonadota bacterium]|nr:MASE1 domain-containing protein [Pseudomonadota bacterium]
MIKHFARHLSPGVRPFFTADGSVIGAPPLDLSMLGVALRVAVFFVAFMLVTHLGYGFAFPPYTGIGVFWPAAGLSLAVLLLHHVRTWPAFVGAIFVGEVVGVAARGLPLPVCLTWGVAAAAEPVLSAWMLTRLVGTPFVLARVRDVVALVAVGAVLAPSLTSMLAASAAVVWLDTPSWWMSWITWWFGDALGVLVVGPLLLVWLGPGRIRAAPRDWTEGALLLVGIVIAAAALFGGPPGAAGLRVIPGFLAFPLMLWAAMRFELRGVTAAAGLLNILAAYHASHGRGLFATLGASPLERLLALQAYLSFATLSTLALSTAFAERRRGERQLQDMIDNSTAVIFAKRTDGRYLFVNRAFEEVVGTGRANVVGRSPYDLWPSRYAEHSARVDEEVLSTGQPRTQEETLQGPGGERTFVAIRFPLLDDLGVPYAICGMATDITDRKRAEEALRRSEERLAFVVAATHDAIYDVDMRTDRAWYSERYRELFGADECADWGARIHPDDRPGVMADLLDAIARHARTWEREYRLRRKGDGYAVVLDNAYLVYGADGRPTRVIGALADVTERREAEEALRLANVDLEQRVERRTVELRAAFAQMESFSYSISHDLRGPLRAINGFGQALQEHLGPSIDPETAGYLTRIRAASRRMGELIDDLLTLSRAGRAEVRQERVDLGDIAAAVLRELAEAEPERRVSASIAPGLEAFGDPGLLRIVLQNLLANAWKFTSQHPTAHIEVGREAIGGEWAFYVRDDGAGFDFRYADKLFRPFERLHKTTEFPGTGIGLATIQRIIGRHGGRVWATGEVEGGATFYFTLPAELPA